MKEVSKKEFFEFINSRSSDDPMPSSMDPNVTNWKNLKGPNRGKVVAKSFPGWKNPRQPKKYEIES